MLIYRLNGHYPASFCFLWIGFDPRPSDLATAPQRLPIAKFVSVVVVNTEQCDHIGINAVHFYQKVAPKVATASFI